MLVVRILRMRPTLSTAWSQRHLDLDWFTSEFVRAAQPPGAPVWNWSLDTIARVLRLDSTCARCQTPGLSARRFRDVTVPLRPMIGNIGVAPPDDQAILSPDVGDYGGNLDYTGIKEGTTLYLPVYHQGALVSVASDMHAAMGDGELAGTGLETSADVDIVLDVV